MPFPIPWLEIRVCTLHYYVPPKVFVVPGLSLKTLGRFHLLKNHQPWTWLLLQGHSAPPVHMTSSLGVHLRPQLASGIVPDHPGSIVSSTAGCPVSLLAHLPLHFKDFTYVRGGKITGSFCSLPAQRDHQDPRLWELMWTLHLSCLCRRWPQTLVLGLFHGGPVPFQRREHLSTQGSLTHPAQFPRQICEPL